MSYILDALRKADADRERGHVPSIHAQTVLPGAAPVGTARGPRVGLWIALAVLLLVTAVGLTWWLVSGSGPRDVPPIAAAARPTPTPAAAMPAPAPVPPTTASAEAPKAAAPAAAASPAATHTAAPKPKPKLAAPPATAKTQTPATAAEALPTPGQAAVAPAGTGPHAGKIYAMTELPDDIRRQLPAVSVGGSMYSPVAANRILIVNGQVLHEGDRVTPEVVLEQVRVKAAVLSFKGYRYLVSF
jgi:general secretion pathway protein B